MFQAGAPWVERVAQAPNGNEWVTSWWCCLCVWDRRPHWRMTKEVDEVMLPGWAGLGWAAAGEACLKRLQPQLWIFTASASMPAQLEDSSLAQAKLIFIACAGDPGEPDGEESAVGSHRPVGRQGLQTWISTAEAVMRPVGRPLGHYGWDTS